MKLVISKSEIGTAHHLSYDGKNWSWVNSFSSDDILWGFDGLKQDLRESAAAGNLEVINFHKTPWGIAQSQVQASGNPRWQHLMPFNVWKKYVSDLVNQLWLYFKDSDNSYYVTTFLRNRELSRSISKAGIREDILRKKIESSKDAQAAVLKKFLPDTSGFAPVSRYSFSKTVTGRMTVESGPNILTLKRENRKILKSNYSNGKIVEIDLQSAEPRVALSLFGKTVSGDVYADVLSSLNMAVTRDAIKVATLAALYGASHHTLKSHLPDAVSSTMVLDRVREYFGVRHIEKMLKDQHDSAGYITNTHGRRIFSEFPSLNHLIQSSAVDVSFDVFESLISKIRKSDIQATPLYFIHDAIILDVSSQDMRKLKEVCKNGFRSPVTKTIFPVKIKEIN